MNRKEDEIFVCVLSAPTGDRGDHLTAICEPDAAFAIIPVFLQGEGLVFNLEKVLNRATRQLWQSIHIRQMAQILQVFEVAQAVAEHDPCGHIGLEDETIS